MVEVHKPVSNHTPSPTPEPLSGLSNWQEEFWAQLAKKKYEPTCLTSTSLSTSPCATGARPDPEFLSLTPWHRFPSCICDSQLGNGSSFYSYDRSYQMPDCCILVLLQRVVDWMIRHCRYSTCCHGSSLCCPILHSRFLVGRPTCCWR